MKTIKILLLAFLCALTLSCEPVVNGGDTPPTPPLPVGTPVLIASELTLPSDGVTGTEFQVFVGEVDVTDMSTIYQVVENQPVQFEGTNFAIDITGTYEFYAYYNNRNSESVNIVVKLFGEELPIDPNPENTNFVNRVLLTQFTGSGCAYCPTATAAIKELQATDYDNKMLVASIHAFNGDDPMYNETTVALTALGVAGFPTVLYNMDARVMTQNEGNIAATVAATKAAIDQKWVEKGDVGISATSVYLENNKKVKVTIGVKAAVESEYRVGVFFLEDNIYAKQSNAYESHEDYSKYDIDNHQNAVRAVHAECDLRSQDFSGEAIGIVKKGEISTITLSVDVDEKWKLENSRLLIYVTSRDEDKKHIVRNVVECPINGEIKFEYLNN